MHLILTGATGLVGSGVLDAMIRSQAVTKISILSRGPVKLAEDRADPRVSVITHRDFETYDAKVLEQLQGADGCVWALGISQSKVGKEEYVKITKDYALAAAKAFSTIKPASTGGAPFRFVYVSGEGATQKPGVFSPIFARVKGETETALAELQTGVEAGAGAGAAAGALPIRAYSVRPAFVDASSHEAIKPYVPSLGILYKGLTGVASVLVRGGLLAGSHSPTDKLGDFLTEAALGKVDGRLEGAGAFELRPGSWVVENVGFRRILGL